MTTRGQLPPPSRPLAVSSGGRPKDDALSKLQHHKMLWIGEPETHPEAIWPDDQPKVEMIKKVLARWLPQLRPGPAENVEVEFLGRGSWNQAFLVVDKDHEHEFIFRVSLPVYPWYKTEAEVATIQFVHDPTKMEDRIETPRQTDVQDLAKIPAPRIYAYDSSAENELGYEWILMEKLPGVPYRTVVDRLSVDARLAVARTVADWMDQLSRHRFHLVGSFYLDDDSEALRLDRPVIQQFMGDWRHDYCHQRGPFDNLQKYIQSFIDCVAAELFDPRHRIRAILTIIDDDIQRLKSSPGHDVGEAAERLEQLEANYSALLASSDVTENAAVDFETFRYRLTLFDGRPYNGLTKNMMRLVRITNLVDTVPKIPLGRDDTVLHHWDISENNVLVDPISHRVTGLIDWEQVYTMPVVLFSTRYPPIMARHHDCPDFDGPPTPPPDAKADTEGNDCGSAFVKSDDVDLWERQLMREEFDRRLQELDSPWLRVGKDSRDEAIAYTGEGDRCQKCFEQHNFTAESSLKDISALALAQVNWFCDGFLDGLEEFEKGRGRAA